MTKTGAAEVTSAHSPSLPQWILQLGGQLVRKSSPWVSSASATWGTSNALACSASLFQRTRAAKPTTWNWPLSARTTSKAASPIDPVDPSITVRFDIRATIYRFRVPVYLA